MTLLSKSDVFVENKLFATLDTTVRKVVLGQTPFLLSDTVGFIRKLPHSLIESFKSTLDEVRESDILLHIVDISHPQFEEQLEVVNQTLAELKVADKPTLVVFNKMDLYRDKYFDAYLDEEVKIEIVNELKENWIKKTEGNCVFVSATNNENIDELKAIILEKVTTQYQVRYPYRTSFYY